MVELETEGELTRSEVAAFLREFAAELDDRVHDEPRDPVTGGTREGTTTAGGTREGTTTAGGTREGTAEDRSADPKRITMIVGGESATVTVPEVVEFDVEVESRSPMFSSSVSQEIEFELSWKIDKDDEEHRSDQIDIE